MPIINVSLIEGRSKTVKLHLMQAITNAVVDALGVPEAAVRVLITEIAPEHWAIGGRPKPPPLGDSVSGG